MQTNTEPAHTDDPKDSNAGTSRRSDRTDEFMRGLACTLHDMCAELDNAPTHAQAGIMQELIGVLKQAIAMRAALLGSPLPTRRGRRSRFDEDMDDDIGLAPLTPEQLSGPQNAETFGVQVIKEAMASVQQLVSRPAHAGPPPSVHEMTMLLQWLDGKQESDLRFLKGRVADTLSMRMRHEQERLLPPPDPSLEPTEEDHS